MDKKRTTGSLRCALYTALFASLLMGLLGLHIVKQNREWNDLDHKVDQLTLMAQKRALKESEVASLKSYYSAADSRYLQKKLEPMALLEEERQALAKLIQSPGFCGNRVLEGRLAFLSGKINRIKIREQPLYTSSHFKEIELTLDHPIEASLHDVEKILRIIEKKEKTKPLLQMREFHLKRKQPLEQNEVFEVTFNVLKREFIHS